jgi:P-type Cu+ transporter
MDGRKKTDPICGQSIDPLRARAVAIVAGERYYFCSVEHRNRFAEAPERYLDAPAPSAPPLDDDDDDDLDDHDEAPEPTAAPEPAPDLLPDAPLPAPPRQVRIEIGGMTGPEDAERVRRALAKLPGVAFVDLDVVTEIASVEIRPDADASPSVLIEALASAGYEASLRATASLDLAAPDGAPGHGMRAAIGLVLGTAGVAAGPWATGLSGLALLGVTAIATGWCLGPLLRAVVARLRRGSLAPELLVVLSSSVSWGLGLYGVLDRWEDGNAQLGGVALAVAALGHVTAWLDARARHQAALELARVAVALPTHARRVRSGSPSEVVKSGELLPGELVRVVAGETVPADGVVRAGQGTVDDSLVSGGVSPASRSAGEPLLAGAKVVSGAFVVEVRRAGRDTLLARVRATISEVQGSSAPLKRIAERSAVFAPWLALLAGFAVLGLALALGRGVSAGGLAAAALWAAASPLALTLIPIPLILAAAGGARRGILYRNAEAVERAGAVTRVVVDKSGTLTADRPRIEEVAVVPGADQGRMLALAAAAERSLESAFARTLRLHAETQGILVPPVDRATPHPGLGVVSVVAGGTVVVGSRRLLERESIDAAEADRLEEEVGEGARSVVFVAIDGVLTGAIGVSDPLRADAGAFVAELRRAGMQLSLTTGDSLRAAAATASPLGIGDVHAGLRPDEKKRAITKLRGDGEVVAAVGDGVADAPALAAADVAVVLARGSEVPLEAGTVTVLRGELAGVAEALRLAHRCLHVMRTNLGGALAYHAFGACVILGLVVVGELRPYAPLAAAAAAAGALALCVGNALRR